MIDTSKQSELRALMLRHNIKFSTRLGQNFLVDANIVKKIAALSQLGPDDCVVEIGPGLGALTVELARRAGKVVAIEIDRRLMSALSEALRGMDNVELVNADFLTYDMSGLPAGCKITGNLPYYITTPLIMKTLEQPQAPASLVFMVQKEVAERIAAPPGSRVYGAVSVAAQYRCAVEYAMDVSKEVFTPRPNVDSAVLVFTPRGDARRQPRDETLFFSVIKAGFGQRRKMLRNALSSVAPDREALQAAFEAAGVPGTARAETLSVEAFIELSDAIHALREMV
jgi:16S rRNA (adenine1518-N6/adenine1519-N6)-dimethyltransferase